MPQISASSALIDGKIVGPTTLVHDGPRIVGLRPRSAGDPPAHDGLLLPFLVNAHLHLELTWAHQQVTGGRGFDAWLGSLLALDRPDDPHVAAGIQQLLDAGTVAVSDICNGPSTAPALADAGFQGVVHTELLGMHGPRLPSLLQAATVPPSRTGGIVRRVSPHSVYSTPAEVLVATLQADGRGMPPTIHISEDLAEHAFLADGTGAWPGRLDSLGLEWTFEPPGCTPLAWLDRLGVLDRVLLVHGVHLTPTDRALVRSSGSSLVLCPRSNLHIGGQLPDVPALLADGILLALGTDSLASSPSLDVLDELPPLIDAFADVPLARWLTMATSGGADALGLPLGRLAVDTAPGVMVVHPEEPWRPRQILLEPARV